jgi:TonB-dependent starch-binding outer membrane protein SusC
MKKKSHFFRLRFEELTKFLLIMRISTLLFLISTLSVSASVYSQSQRFNLTQKDATIRQVFDEIEKQTSFKFFYLNEQIDDKRMVDMALNNTTVEEVLEKMFDPSQVKYKVFENHLIVISPTFTVEAAKQQQKITGKVTDATTSEALVGVNVVVEGTTTGTVTDISGNFSLEIPNTNATLIISYIGYNTEKVNIAGRTNVVVQLVPDITKLDEVVVIGYGTQKKADVTSSIASVKPKEFIQGSVKDIGQLVQGKVAGLTINSVNGDPTSNTEIKLRGNSTLSGTSTSPLILIDGVPGDFNSVAPGDVESIDVLKDGSAAAIYGTRGTNGVIIIVTKRASGRNINSIEYSGYANTQTIAKKLDMSTAADVRQQIADGYRSSSDDKGSDTNWLNEITRAPVSHVHNLTIRGGSEKTNYLFNANYKDLQGIFLKSDNKVTNIRADINHSLFNDLIKINIGALSRYINDQCTGDGYSFNGYTYRQANIYNPTAPVKNADGTWYEETGAFNYDNPVSRINECDGAFSSQWTRMNGTITIEPIKNLQLKALLSYSKYNEERGYAETKKNISTLRSGYNGYASNGTVESVDRLADLTAQYSKKIGDHHFSVLGGYSYSENNYRQFWEKNVDFPTDVFGYNDIALGKGITEGNSNAGIGSSKTETNLIAFFGRGTYNFKDRYLFMGSLRYEAASQLYGTKNPWGWFPSISAGWRISNESFMKDISFISDLKLRAGYGVTGTQPSSLFLGVASIGYSGYYYSDGSWKNYLAPTRNPNPYLRWEEKHETNVGVDFGLLNGRINGSVDYYIRRINGLLMSYTVPMPPNLVSSTMANVGKMENKGVEILINVIPVKEKNFDWTTSVTYSTNKNKLITLSNELYTSTTNYITAGSTGEPIQTYTHRLDVGGKIGNFYGFKVVDISDDGRWVYQNKSGNRINSADFARVDSNKMVLGNGLPKFYLGWTNAFRYKNFDLSISMRGAFGFQILNFERMYLENTQTTAYNRLKSAYDKVWGKAVLSKKEDLEFNSYYVENGDYWKIDNITLGYNFKVGKIKFIKSARIYVSSLNTYTITGYKGIDPEVTIDGLTPGNDYRDKYPTTRTFTIGFNANF